MDLTCRIIDQGALQEREYTNPQTGMTEKFASMGFTLENGGDRFYCEMVQEQARKQPQLSRDYYYRATLLMKVAEWKDKNGGTHYENRLTLTRIAPL